MIFDAAKQPLARIPITFYESQTRLPLDQAQQCTKAYQNRARVTRANNS
jgi:hypothetical protein